MDHARRLSESIDAASFAADCPDCSAPASKLPPGRPTLLGSIPVRRCLRCGRRSSDEPAPSRLLDCRPCGLFYLEGTDVAGRCPQCVADGVAPEQPEPEMIAATEAEVLAAVGEAWELVGSPASTAYLGRVLGSVARSFDGLPAGARVLLVREPSLRCLALPSGTIVLGTGLLAALENEAELAFVLGHELAHVASGDAGRSLVRAGLRAAAVTRPEGGASWLDAALDLLWLGYGDRVELAADASALEAAAVAGYDTGAALRWLKRVDESCRRGEAAVAELQLAHPCAAERVRRLEMLGNRNLAPGGEPRVDREVFRRRAGHSVLAGELERIEPCEPQPPVPEPARLLRSRLLWGLVGLLLVCGLLTLWGLI